MTRKIFLGFFTLITLCSLTLLFGKYEAHAEEADINELTTLLTKYYNEGVYTKTTHIYLNESAVKELLVNGGFHADSSILERTTHYKHDELWMSRGPEKDLPKYSYYGTAYDGETPVGITNAVTTNSYETPENAPIVLSGTEKTSSMQNYYTGLEDIVAKSSHNWTISSGVYTTTDKEVISWFKDFAAPCYLGFVKSETQNYISLDKVTIEEVGSQLMLKLYATADNEKLNSEESGLFSSAVISKASYWDGETISTGFASGTGSKEDPYIIENAAQFAYLKDSTTSASYYKDKYIKLEADINLADVAWDGIAGTSTSTSFAGNFDGSNHVIYNVNINATKSHSLGLFNRIKGSLNNLSVCGNIETNAYYVGLLVGLSYGSIDNCHAYGTLNTTSNRAGLLVGCQGGASVSNCSVAGSITATNKVAGIIGYNWKNSGSTANIENCVNYANVTATAITTKDDSPEAAGGVVGNCDSGAVISNCHNYGVVKAGEACGDAGIGGIVGYLSSSSITSNSYNYGMVEGVENVGGIIGYADGEIANSANFGDVNASSNYAGGIVGSTNNFVNNCENSGNVNASSYAGGITGNNTNVISNCTNTKEAVIFANSYVGGIVGSAGKSSMTDFTNTYITDCYNYGSVSSNPKNSSGGAGGIAGFTYCDITKCENYGDISGGYRVGGIAGGAKYSASTEAIALTISGCYNAGEITASEQTTGGIVCRVEGKSSSKVVVQENKNSGNVVCLGADTSYTGGIVGYAKYANITNNQTSGVVTIAGNVSETYVLFGTLTTGVTNENNRVVEYFE